MIKYLTYEQIDKEKWDACITASAENKVYALSWFLDVVSPGWQGIVEEQSGRYVMVMPLPGFQKVGFPYLGQPYHTHQLGIFTTAQSNSHVREEFIKLAVQQYRFIYNYRFNNGDTAVLEQLQQNYELVPRFTRHLDLSRPYVEIYKNYSRSRKTNLNRAKRESLEVIESDDIEPLIQHFKAHVERKVVGGVAEDTYQMLRDLFKLMQQKQLAKLLYTTANGEINAGCLFIVYNGVVSYSFNSADSRGRTDNGRVLILDRIIRQFAGSDYVLDFESPMISQVDQFYSRFGAEQVKYFALRHNGLPLYVRLIRNIRMKIYRTFFSSGVAEEV